MAYTVTLLRPAQKTLLKIDPHDREAITHAIQMLAIQPRPAGSKKLKDSPAWRLRVGNYRVVYEINDEWLTVLIIKLGHRKDIY